MTRIAVGGFLHETNTFAPTKATMPISCMAAAGRQWRTAPTS